MRDAWLKSRTGKDFRWWNLFVGNAIARHARKTKKSVHDEVDVPDWMGDFTEELDRRVSRLLPSNKYDNNMAFAASASYVLMRWFVRLARAKSYDPRRPVKVRRKMMGRLTEYCREVVGFMVDESGDADNYPKQEWDPPFAPGAKDGKYT